jgi:hypothetical protein
MDRRTIAKALPFALGLFAAARAEEDASAAGESGKPKAVYHLADLDKVAFVLGNIANHYDGMGGPDKVTLALVIHGPALKAFHAAGAEAGLARRSAEFVKDGLELAACVHTMKAENVTLADLLPGFTVAERGGVVRLAELQAEGYAYLRP